MYLIIQIFSSSLYEMNDSKTEFANDIIIEIFKRLPKPENGTYKRYISKTKSRIAKSVKVIIVSCFNILDEFSRIALCFYSFSKYI